MCSKMKFWMTLACFSVLGCAEGSPSQPIVPIEPPLEMAPPTCGNGKVDVAAGEQCDCGPMVSTQCQVVEMGMDCMAVNRGAGTLLCNAAPACTFNFSMCAINTPAAGAGTGATMPGGTMRGTGGTGR